MKKYIKSLILILIILPCIAFMTACGTKTYTVSFDSNGGSAVNAIENIESGSKIDKPEDPTKNGYNFNGWFLNDEEWDFENNTISSDISLKASWTPIVYSITYNLNGSTNHQLNPSEFTIESETISLKAPTLTGYAFVGWYDNEDFLGNPITTIDKGTIGNIELYARFVFDSVEGGSRILTSYEDVKYYLSNSNLSQNFKLANDIDFYGKEWTAYGSEAAQYNGVFDGNGHSIKNIKILENAQFVGFFGYVGINGTIKNLEIKNAEINLTSTGSSSVGIISGFCSGNLIKCSASGSITLNQTGCTYCGGLAGVAVNILECSSAVNINVYTKPISINDETYGSASLITGNIGGLVGSIFTIQDSYSSSSINIEQVENKSLATTVESYIVGGLAGEGAHTTENSYSTTNISLNLTKSIAPEVFVSSLVGRIMFDGIEGVNLSNCYATGNILIQATNSNNIHTGQLLNSITTINSTQIENSYLLNTQTIKINNYEISRSNCADNAFVVCADLNAIKSNVVSKWDNNVWNTTSNTPSLKKEIGECFIYFETNGGSHVEKIPVAYEGTAQAPTPPTKEGYIFENWYYEDAVWYFGLSVRKTITLEARYTPRTYTVSFQDAEGNQVCEDKYFTFNNPYTLPEYITYQGHYFNLNEDIFNSYYWTYNGNALDDANWTIADNAILVLASTPKKYQVLYFLDGGENNQSNPTTYTYIDYFYELQPATKDGYTFIGWYSHQNLQEVYKVTNLSEIVDPELPKTVSLYARFAVAQYSIMYETYGATNSINNPTSYNINTETIHLHSITKDGYSFAGWYDSENFTTTANKITVIPKGTAGNIKLYAYWQVLNYAIVYNLNGGTNDAENPLFYTVEDFIFLKDAEKPYHDFVGWYQTPDFSDYATYYIPVGTTEPLVLYAKFRLTTYTIQYVDTGDADGLQTKYNYQSSTFIFPTISKSGYNFLGWIDEQGHPITKIQKGSYGNRVITATWQIINYTITYQTNGGTLPNNTSTTFNAENIVTFATPTKRGYDFLGWKLQDEVNLIYSTNGLFRNITLVAYWDYTVYTIDYSLDDGIPVSSLKYTYILCDSYTLPELTKDGYTFDGWFDDDNFETANKVTGFEVGTIGNKYFFAKFTIINYTITYVTYDKNVNNSANTVSYTVLDNNITLQNITRTGYTFAGWYDGENFEAANKVTTISTQTKANITLYARWQIINYSITYIADVETESYTKTYTVEDSIALTIPELTGKTVSGWIDTNNGNNIITTIPKGTTGDKILELSWEYITYTITYVTNGGAFSVQEITTFNVDDSIELSIPEKTHYTFDGWFAESTFENKATEIEKGTAENKTFYAKWTAITYTISYQPNNGTLSGSEATSYTIENHVTFEIPTRTGYEFKGWFTTLNFESNTQIESTSELIPTLGTVKIYAKWQPINYSIIYNTNGGTLSGSQKTTYTILDEFDFEIPTKAGYEFNGWFTTSTFENGTDLNSISAGSINDIEIYANWQIINYSITYNTNDGTLSGSQKTTYTILDKFDFEIPTKAGYEFKGWFTTSNFETASKVECIEKGTFQNITLYAKWQLVNYSIIYNTNGGTLSGSQKTTYTIEDEFNFEIPTKAGYEFKGWFTTSTFEDETDLNSISAGSIGNIEIYAQWQIIYIISYTTYDENVDNSANRTSFTIETETFNIEDVSRTGYTFIGWFDSENFETANKIECIEKGTFQNITLYANWQIINYSITYNTNGGTLSGSQKTTYTILDEFDFEIPTKAGYEFNGWFTTSTFENGTDLNSISAGSINGIEIYANWQIINYSITYNTNDGTLSGFQNTSYTVLDEFVFEEPYKHAYLFLGWFDSEDFETANKIEKITVGTTGNITLFAKYSDTHDHEGYYKISTPETLTSYSGSENARLYSSVNLNNAEWTPINLNKVNFDGNDFVISNFKITKGRYINGFFGEVSNSTISNLGLENFTIDYEYSSFTYAGGLVGYAYDSTITNSYATGDVSATGEETYWGRIVAGGNPTIINCYELMESIKITSKEDLLKLNQYTCVQDIFELTTNIDLDGIEWTPINIENASFNGNGFVISNFKITTGREYNGFFGRVKNSTISNLGLENFTVDYECSRSTYAGGLVGEVYDYDSSTTITNCYATGDVSATSTSDFAYAGGLVGRAYDDFSSIIITNCYATGDVSATSSHRTYAGGLLGEACYSTTIINCYATGNVSATSNSYSAYAGGLVGDVSGSTITNCYATGNVSATSTSSYAYAGGLVGCASFKITNSYRYAGQTVTAIKGESIGIICTGGTSASMETIWVFVKENWETEVWELFNDKNPTLKKPQT